MSKLCGKILVVASQKGGVGKTTLALNLAYALAQRGWRTLLADADPQGSLGLSIRGDLRRRPGLAELLRGEAALAEVSVTSRLAQLKLLPVGRVPAVEAARWTAELQDGRGLAAFFAEASGLHDVVLLDTPPGMAGVALGALRGADYVAVPLQAEPLAARSVHQILEVIAALRAEGAPAQLMGLVLNMLQSRHQDSLAVAQESWRLFPGHHVLDATVPRGNVFLEASAEGVPVALLRRRPPAVAAVFDQLAAEIETKIGLETLALVERRAAPELVAAAARRITRRRSTSRATARPTSPAATSSPTPPAPSCNSPTGSTGRRSRSSTKASTRASSVAAWAGTWNRPPV